MASFWVWGVALAAYAIFLGWYVNWLGPLSKGEIEGLMARMRASNVGHGDQDEMPVIQQFLEEDDGREFFMLNVVRMSDGDVADPVTGTMRPAREIMAGYTRMFMPALFARGGHPALAARRIGGSGSPGGSTRSWRTSDYGWSRRLSSAGMRKPSEVKSASSSTACQSLVSLRAKACRSGMKPIHWVNSAPQLLQRMLRMCPGVTRIQRWRIILQESSQRQKGHFIRGFRREIGNVAMRVNASRSRSRAWRRGRRAFLRVG